MKKIYIIMVLVLALILPSILGEQETLGSFKQNTCLQLIQTCNCSFVNISSVYNPEANLMILNVPMEKRISDFNLTYCKTSIKGRYIVQGIGDVDGINKVFSYDFYVTTEGQLLSNYWTIALVMLFIYLLLIIGIAKEERVFVILSAMAMIIIGIYIHYYGMGDMRNNITTTFGIINWAVGAYVFLRSTVEWARDELGE